jgi:hypothetical protein
MPQSKRIIFAVPRRLRHCPKGISSQKTGKEIVTGLALSLVPQKCTCKRRYYRGSTVALLRRVPDIFWCPEEIMILCIPILQR